MRTALCLLTLSLAIAACAGSTPPPEEGAHDTLNGEKPLPPDNIPPTLEEPPAPEEPAGPPPEKHEAPPTPPE